MDNVDLNLNELILDFELERDPFQFQVDGTSLWPLFRFPVHEQMRIATYYGHAARYQDKKSLTLKLGIILRLIQDICEMTFNKRKLKDIDLLIISNANRLRDRSNQHFKNIYFDYFSLEDFKPAYVYKIPGHAGRLKNYPYPVINELVFRLTMNKVSDGDLNIVKELYGAFASFLEKRGCAEYFHGRPAEWIKRARQYIIKTRQFKIWLKEHRPKQILLDCCYGKEWAIAAAKSLGIPVWELQHGILYDGHMGYTYSPQSAKQYRDNLPLPDKIFTFGRVFSEILTQRGFWEDSQIQTLGFPRFNLYQKKFVHRAEESIGPIKVLISSQWIVADRLYDYLKGILEKLPEDIEIHIKPHPDEPKASTERYQALSDRLKVLDMHGNFYTILEDYHIHATVFSTTLLESFGLGVPTIVINLPGSENAQSFCRYQGIKFAQTIDEIVMILEKAKKDPTYLKGWKEAAQRECSDFWEANSEVTFKNILESAVQ